MKRKSGKFGIWVGVLLLLAATAPAGCKKDKSPSVALNAAEAALQKYATLHLQAVVRNTDEAVAWACSDARVASVDSNGLVTALDVGGAVVTASAGGASAACAVTVLPVTDGEFSLGIKTLSLYSGYSARVTPIMFLDGERQDMAGTAVAYSSDAPAVASVNAAGVVTGVSSGAARVTGTCEWRGKRYSASVALSVDEFIVVELDRASLDLVLTGGGGTLSASVKRVAANGAEALPDAAVVWSSSDPETASVAQSGAVAPLKVGTAYITAAVGAQAASCKVDVVDKLISTPAQFWGVRGAPNLAYKLAADVDFAGFDYASARLKDGSAATAWVSLTESDYADSTESDGVTAKAAFTGTFDGNGYSVRNIALGDGIRGSVFGNIEGGSVKNTSFEGIVSSCYAFGGGVASQFFDAKITDCFMDIRYTAMGWNGNGAANGGLFHIGNAFAVKNCVVKISTPLNDTARDAAAAVFAHAFSGTVDNAYVLAPSDKVLIAYSKITGGGYVRHGDSGDVPVGAGGGSLGVYTNALSLTLSLTGFDPEIWRADGLGLPRLIKP
jgi:uncharacterized protein YjdB